MLDRFTRWRTPLTTALLILVVALVTLSPQPGRVEAAGMFGELRVPGQAAFVAGHRGDRSTAPENTLPAFRHALASDLDFVETDLQLTKDGVIVLIHDDTVDRTTNGHGEVSDFTYAKLRRLDAGRWYSPKYAGTRIPTLDALLELLAPSQKKAILELKGFWTVDQVQQARDAVEVAGVASRVVFASKNFGSLENLERGAPGYPKLIIQRDLPADPVRLARFYHSIGIITTVKSLESNPDALLELHEVGLGLLLYTLNGEKRWSAALALGVDGIVTDKPSKLDKWLAKTAPGT